MLSQKAALHRAAVQHNEPNAGDLTHSINHELIALSKPRVRLPNDSCATYQLCFVVLHSSSASMLCHLGPCLTPALRHAVCCQLYSSLFTLAFVFAWSQWQSQRISQISKAKVVCMFDTVHLDLSTAAAAQWVFLWN